MVFTRRAFVTWVGLGAVWGAVRIWAAGRPVAVDPDAFAKALAQEIGANPLIDTDRINLELPQIAEDGAVVPISVETSLSELRELVILVEKNPTPVAARFLLDPSLDPFVSLRIKMNETGDVVVVAKAANGYYTARRHVQVMVGGCG